MTDLALLRACGADPSNTTALLVAADYFDDIDEGNDPSLARALRWMAEHGKYPHKVPLEKPQRAGHWEGDDLRHEAVYTHYWRWYEPGDKGAVPHATLDPKSFPTLADCAAVVGGVIHHNRYYSFTGAVLRLAEALRPPPSE